jgi:hypothetical protein
MSTAEMNTAYGARPEGSESKLRTYRDGWRILMTILRLFKLERPLLFFSIGGALVLLLALILAAPLVVTYLETGLVPRFPTAILCSALVLLGALSAMCGLVLDTVTRGRIEAKHMAYLTVPGLDAGHEDYPEATYFNVGKIAPDQALDLATRSGADPVEVERALAPNLNL